MRARVAASSLVAYAPAKLNLYLKIHGRRSDGFHVLETVMVSLGLYDSLLFQEDFSGQLRLDCRQGEYASSVAQNVTSQPNNLVLRAAELLRRRTGCERGASITLIKRIPVQAGLGGGSSDAAATLAALNQLWELSLPSATLHELAAALGSDVNFFVDSPRAAICRGRGEQVEPIPLPRRLHVVLVCPSSGLSTADVFREWSSSPATPGSSEPGSAAAMATLLRHGRACAGAARSTWNDLEAPARRLNGDVDLALRVLRRACTTPVGMSGSGTSCFALCPTADHARRLARRLRSVAPGRVVALDSRS
jgi:4-diphosphocytidyl-2-C-methyl-D-erythritol kinase